MRLFCLPYAGGSARVFADWQADVPQWLEVVPLELPGRGTRFGEAPHTRLEFLLDDLHRDVAPRLDEPFAVFGHSLGAMLGYELVRMLAREGRQAEHLFVSGAGAPHIPTRKPAYHLSDDDFRRHLRDLGGTPPEVVESDELMDLLLPVLRADFTIADTYVPLPGEGVDCPVTAFCGDADEEAPPRDVMAWRRYARAGFNLRMLPGGHFFLDSARHDLLTTLATSLRASTARRGISTR